MGDHAHSGGWGQDRATAPPRDEHPTMGDSKMTIWTRDTSQHWPRTPSEGPQALRHSNCHQEACNHKSLSMNRRPSGDSQLTRRADYQQCHHCCFASGWKDRGNEMGWWGSAKRQQFRCQIQNQREQLRRMHPTGPSETEFEAVFEAFEILRSAPKWLYAIGPPHV